MSAAKHTPGPWDAVRQDDASGEIWFDIWSAAHGSVAHVHEGARPDGRVKFTRADAEAIAATPDVRLALQAFVDLSDAGEIPRSIPVDMAIAGARAALAKGRVR